MTRPFYRADKGCWYARIDGRRMSLGVRGFENEKAALDQWHKLSAFKRPEEKQDVPTVARIVALFLGDAEKRVGAETYSHYSKFLSLFVDQYAHRPCDKLTPTVAEQWARKPTWSNSTRNDALGSLATCFRWAERSRLIDRSPLRGMRLPPKESRGCDAVISDESYAKLLANTSGDFRQLCRFLWETGCRPSEATGLTAAAVDIANACIVLKRHKTAGKGKARVIHLNAEALSVVREQAATHPVGFLFPAEGGEQLDCYRLSKRFRRLSKRLGIRATAYGFRHSTLTRWLRKGMPDTYAAALAGHASTAMIHKHYSHLGSASAVLRQALAAM